MNSCWKFDTKIRPTFKELVPKIESLLTDNHKKVCFNVLKKYLLRGYSLMSLYL